MNRLFLLITLFTILFLPAESAFANNEKPLLIVGDESYAPFEFLDSTGKPNGIFVDIWKKWSEKTGIPVEYRLMKWSEALEMVKTGKADAAGGLFRTEEREKTLIFSKSYMEIQTHVFFHKNIYGLHGIHDLKGFRIGVVREDSSEQFIKNNLPGSNLVLFSTYSELVDAAIKGDIRVFVADTPVALFHLSKYETGRDFNHTLDPLYSSKVHSAAAKNHLDTLNRINAGFAKLEDSEIEKIISDWAGIPLIERLPWRFIAGGIFVVFLCLILILLWNTQLRRKVTEATHDLEQKQNELNTELNERIKIEEALRASEERYRFLIESMNDGLAVQTKSGLFTFINHRFSEMLGYEVNEIVNHNVTDFLDDENSRIMRNEISRRTPDKKPSPYELVWSGRDNKKVATIVTPSPIYSEKNEYEGSFAVLTDITERKRTEQAMIESERRYRDLFHSISDLIYTLDLDGRFLSINTAVAATFGYDAGELIGRRITDLMEEKKAESFKNEHLDRLIDNGKHEGVLLLNTRDGKDVYIDHKSSIVTSDGKEAYISGSARDITEKVIAEKALERTREQLLQAQKMEAVGTLASGIAHDFNNILQAISGYVQLLSNTSSLGPTEKKYLIEVDQAAGRASELVKRLLTFSRKIQPRLYSVDLNQEIRNTLGLLERVIPKMIDIQTRLYDGKLPVDVDRNQLEQIIMNLSTNARDAMPQGGVLTIKTSLASLNAEFCRGLDIDPGIFALLGVKDTGVGISPATLSHVFDPFFTTKELGKGTGLGLSTVYGIVKNHHGHISINSDLGRGTEINIYIPLNQGKTQLEDRHDFMDIDAARGSETILLVDDEQNILEIAQEVLESNGYDILGANSGEEALEKFSSAPERIALVILDIGMPGMGGIKCLELLLSRKADVKVIITSGYGMEDQANELLAKGARAFIPKPYRLSELLKLVRSTIDQV